MPEEIVVTKIFSNEIGAAMVQEVNWINRVLTCGILAMIIFLATSPPIYAGQLHHPVPNDARLDVCCIR